MTSFPTTDAEISTFSLLISHSEKMYADGRLFRGLLPYIISSIVYNYSTLESSLKTLFSVVSHRLPKSLSDPMMRSINSFEMSPSRFSKIRDNFQQQQQLTLRDADAKSTLTPIKSVSRSLPSLAHLNSYFEKEKELRYYKRRAQTLIPNAPSSSHRKLKSRPSKQSINSPSVSWFGCLRTSASTGIAAALVHPFYALAVRMATATDYSQDAWKGKKNGLWGYIYQFFSRGCIQSYFKIVSSEGWLSLYRGLRFSVSAALLYRFFPLATSCVLGAGETFLNRRILTWKGCTEEGFASDSMQIHFNDSFKGVLRNMLSEGYSGVFRCLKFYHTIGAS